MDFKLVSHGLWSEKQNVLLQHMHKKEFWILTNKCGNNLTYQTRLNSLGHYSRRNYRKGLLHLTRQKFDNKNGFNSNLIFTKTPVIKQIACIFILRTGMVKFGLTWLENVLRTEGYIVSEALDTAKLAIDVRARLVENDIPVTSFIVDGTLFKLRFKLQSLYV